MELGAYPYAGIVMVGIIIYMVGMIVVGWWSARRIKTSTDYIVAGRRLPLFFATGTLFATWFCAGTLMGPHRKRTCLETRGSSSTLGVPLFVSYSPASSSRAS